MEIFVNTLNTLNRMIHRHALQCHSACMPLVNQLISTTTIGYTLAMWKLIKMMIALGLLPLAWAVSVSTYALGQTASASSQGTGVGAWALPIGFLAWVGVFFLLPRPFRTYVLGHELTHALWAVMMGARVGKMKVGRKGGHVELSKSNFIITLAPYFFPFYTALVITAYCLIGNWISLDEYRVWWLAAIGLTWSFHITFTIHMLSQQQPDVQEHGRIFSFTVIYIMNVLVIALLMIGLGESRFLMFGDLLGHETATVYRNTYEFLERTGAMAARMISSFR